MIVRTPDHSRCRADGYVVFKGSVVYVKNPPGDGCKGLTTATNGEADRPAVGAARVDTRTVNAQVVGITSGKCRTRPVVAARADVAEATVAAVPVP